MAKRKRRAFTKEFKAEAVRLVRESGKSVPTVARELDLRETALRSWVRQGEIDAGRGTPGALTTAEREELGQLRRENRTLRMERDILKKRRPSSRRSIREIPVHRRGEGRLPGPGLRRHLYVHGTRSIAPSGVCDRPDVAFRSASRKGHRREDAVPSRPAGVGVEADGLA